MPPILSSEKGVALIIAVSLLGLFSVLGASYLRFMSLELDECDFNIRNARIRQYAAAGIQSAMGQVHAAINSGVLPADAYIFSYAVYGEQQGTPRGVPAALSDYSANANVKVVSLTETEWQNQFKNGPAWPGDGRSFLIASDAILARDMLAKPIPIAHYAVEAVVIAQNGGCDIIYWTEKK